jgi:secreted trypsin-like serine protease
MFTLRRLSGAAVAVVGLVSAGGSVAPAEAMSGGHAANPAEVPWFASILLTDSGLPYMGATTPAQRATYDNPVNRGACGGALVAPDKVVTAAHCVADDADKVLPATAFTVRLGGAPLSDTTVPTVPVTNVKVSPSFRRIPSTTHPDQPNLDAAVSDVAVLTLARPVSTPRVPLATSTVAPGTPLRAFGHGIRPGLPAGQLRADALEVGGFTAMSTDQAAALWNPAISHTGLLYFADHIAYPTGGDSGAPVIRGNSERAELVGMFSFGADTLAGGVAGPNFTAGPDASTIASMLR